MTSQRKLERDLIYADLAAVTALLEQLDEEDVMSRVSREARRDELMSAQGDALYDSPRANVAM